MNRTTWRRNPHPVGSQAALAWDKGWRSQRNGLPLGANAYVEKYGQLTRFNAWKAGWLAAAAEEREKSKEERGGVAW